MQWNEIKNGGLYKSIVIREFAVVEIYKPPTIPRCIAAKILVSENNSINYIALYIDGIDRVCVEKWESLN